MRVSDLISMGKQYVGLAMMGVFILGILFAVSYLVVYRILMKGKKTIGQRQILLSAVSIAYMIVVTGVVFFNRSGGYQSVNIHLFSSYREAWNNFSAAEWRNIILNIILFVPLGVLLPLWSVRFKSVWKSVLMGFVISALIECLQFVSHRGIFEVDDIFNNTLGTLIGYGYIMTLYLWIDGVKMKWFRLLGYFLPTVLTATTFLCIFVIYQHNEFGNLSNTYHYQLNMKDVKLTSKADIIDHSKKAEVYASVVAKEEETYEFAKIFFKRLGQEIDNRQTDRYDNTVFYYSQNRDSNLSINYSGLTYSYTDFSSFECEVNSAASEEVIREALNVFGITITADADHHLDENGEHCFEVDREETEEGMLNGTLTCQYYEDCTIKEIQNDLITYKPVRQCSVISQKKAYEKLKRGKFNYNNRREKIKSIVIEDVNLDYARDTKGYFQPVYHFQVQLNGSEDTIIIPALK